MKYAFVVLLSSMVFFCCGDDDAFEHFECEGLIETPITDCDWMDQQYLGLVFPSKRLDLKWRSDLEAYVFAGFEDSTTTIINLLHYAGHCSDYSDDEWSQFVFFEIPGGITSFDYSDEELIDLRCFHRESGAWISTLPVFITEGRVAGEKIDDMTWEIAIGITLPDSTSRGNTCIEYKGGFLVE